MEIRDEIELRAYREKVVSELERRMLVLQGIDRRLDEARYAFNEEARNSRGLRGSTARIQVENAHRLKLKSALKVIERERLEANAELQRAELRLREVDMRLDSLAAKGSKEG